jgi:CMP/dCMP kinase
VCSVAEQKNILCGRFVITIDGPAASGKSTVARLLAAKLDATFLDTGAMYRAVTLAAMNVSNRRAGLAPPMFSPQVRLGVGHCEEQREVYPPSAGNLSQKRILDVLDETVFEFEATPHGMLVRIDGVDVTGQIRDPKVTANARYVACLAPARQRLVDMQRRFAESHSKVVTEGRDQGTVAFPDADVKFYLTADLDERARRRQAELKAKGVIQTDDEIRQAILKRDQSDENRAVGPLKPADDAVIVDTTGLTIEEVVEKLIDCVNARLSE